LAAIIDAVIRVIVDLQRLSHHLLFDGGQFLLHPLSHAAIDGLVGKQKRGDDYDADYALPASDEAGSKKARGHKRNFHNQPNQRNIGDGMCKAHEPHIKNAGGRVALKKIGELAQSEREKLYHGMIPCFSHLMKEREDKYLPLFKALCSVLPQMQALNGVLVDKGIDAGAIL
jgi:hypothetical protein